MQKKKKPPQSIFKEGNHSGREGGVWKGNNGEGRECNGRKYIQRERKKRGANWRRNRGLPYTGPSRKEKGIPHNKKQGLNCIREETARKEIFRGGERGGSSKSRPITEIKGRKNSICRSKDGHGRISKGWINHVKREGTLGQPEQKKKHVKHLRRKGGGGNFKSDK